MTAVLQHFPMVMILTAIALSSAALAWRGNRAWLVLALGSAVLLGAVLLS